MTVYMPPIARKKRVDCRYNPDTFRVISEEAESVHQKFEPQPYRASFEPVTPQEPLFPEISTPHKRTRVLPHATPDYRHNCPQPKKCSFIETNAHLLNEPICVHKPTYTKDSTYRNEFMYTKQLAPKPHFRHSANPNQKPACGVVPVNMLHEMDGTEHFYKERLSFEHQYNSRTDPNYPIRGKRHGAFVVDRIDQESAQRFIDYHTKLNDECPIVTNFGSPRLNPIPVPELHCVNSHACALSKQTAVPDAQVSANRLPASQPEQNAATDYQQNSLLASPLPENVKG
ncbi:uncharacterized protein LOC112570412 [Pomacea canaliculata]|nr:uncharacterized protein LOC112570412 [Pomacea canaliculata]